ncbi:substrate-binding periplasmic protein [Alteromonas gilva]|uniref:Transporter substrate-binding domain-containing protein n=1 Tax=Alteromonas gilva TaxID=2987522 RepID=A0ABT5L577_9ALTE|nr:transporter substrate-binding domain-containing protein [Alteromonas gilva]MDC8832195.1 transporter substrate-binding domain-containing protein [Alteromonas gilva]
MRLIVLFCAMFAALPALSNQPLNKTITLASAKDWKPYIYVNAQGKVAGTDYDLLRKTLQQSDVTLRTENLPEQRLAKLIEEGSVGVILGAAFTTDRHKHNYFSIPYRRETIVLGFRRSRHSAYSKASITDVLAADKLVALNRSGWFGEVLSDQLLTRYNNNIVHAEGTQRRLQLLMLDRVDAVVGDVDVLMAGALELGIDDFAVSEIPIHQTDVHFMFGHKQVTAAFVQQFNQSLAALITPAT